MATKYREKALKLEGNARQASVISKYSRYKDYKEDATKLYEEAGDAWIKQAGLKVNIRDIKNSLSYAFNDYNSAIKLAETIEEKQRMQNKKNSIGKKISSFKISRGGLEKKFVFASLSIISLVFALFFSISSLTGYSVKGLADESFRFGGVILFVCGLVFAFCYFRNKK